jgi:hypothetical protein
MVDYPATVAGDLQQREAFLNEALSDIAQHRGKDGRVKVENVLLHYGQALRAYVMSDDPTEPAWMLDALTSDQMGLAWNWNKAYKKFLSGELKERDKPYYSMGRKPKDNKNHYDILDDPRYSLATSAGTKDPARIVKRKLREWLLGFKREKSEWVSINNAYPVRRPVYTDITDMNLTYQEWCCFCVCAERGILDDLFDHEVRYVEWLKVMTKLCSEYVSEITVSHSSLDAALWDLFQKNRISKRAWRAAKEETFEIAILILRMYARVRTALQQRNVRGKQIELQKLAPILKYGADYWAPYRDEWRTEEFIDSLAYSGSMTFGPSGHGKSRLYGRGLLMRYLKDGIGTVCIDPSGDTIDNFLDAARRHKDWNELQHKIVYCNMAGEEYQGTTYVSGWPIIHKRYPNERADQTAARLVNVVKKADEHLANAPIAGGPRVSTVLSSLCKVLAVMELPIKEAFEYLEQPRSWDNLLIQAERRDPSVRRAVRHLRNFAEGFKYNFFEKVEPIYNRLAPIDDPVSETMFNAPTPQVDLDDVVENGKIVLIDLRFDRVEQQALEFKLLWVWEWLKEYVNSRANFGYELKPLALVLDELSWFTQPGTHMDTDSISSDFQQFVSVNRRKANVYVAAAAQEQHQLSEGMLNACFSLPTQLYGSTISLESALQVSRRFFFANPYRIKRQMIQHQTATPWWSGPGEFVVTSTIFETMEEQQYLKAWGVTRLVPNQWLYGRSQRGEPAKQLEPALTEQLDKDIYPEAEKVELIRKYLAVRDGIPVGSLAPPALDNPAPSPSPDSPTMPIRRIRRGK